MTKARVRGCSAPVLGAPGGPVLARAPRLHRAARSLGVVDETGFVERMSQHGRQVYVWANAAGTRYEEHSHPYRKYLCCLAGSIVFSGPQGEVALAAGDELVLEAGTPHSALVGPCGVRCAEAHQ